MRYIVKATGAKGAQTASLQNTLQGHNARIIDGSMLPDMALVDLDAKNVSQLRTQLGDQWTLFPEKTYSVPDTRKKIRK